jgi:hypothetical protein
MRDRNVLAKEVIAELGLDDMVFGGYVRDQIANLPFSDVDLFLHSAADDRKGNRARRDFIWKLRDNFRVEMLGSVTRTYQGVSRLYKQRLRVFDKENPQVFVDVDLVTHQKNDPFLALDADVNSLCMKDGKIHAAQGLSLEEIKQNISKKVFEPAPGADVASEHMQERFNKLLSKGFCFKQKDEDATTMTLKAATTAPAQEGFIGTLKHDGGEALYRVASTQISKGTRAGIVKMLKARGFKAAQIRAITELMETEIGRAMVSGLLGIALPHVPNIGEDPRAKKLASEFRIDAMATVGNELIEEVKTMLAPVFLEAFMSLPPVTLDDVIKETEKKAREAQVTEQVKVPAQRTA